MNSKDKLVTPPLGVWFHEKVLRHVVGLTQMPVSLMTDEQRGALTKEPHGLLWTCECKKTWTK